MNCSHIICTQCILSDLVDDLFYCPECYSELSGNLDEISVKLNIDDVIDSDCSTVEESNEDSFNATESVRNTVHRNICSFVNCSNKSYDNSNFCMKHCGHTTKDLTEVNQIASDLQNAGFNFKATRNNKIEPIAKRELNSEDLKSKFVKQKRIDLGDAMDLIDKAKDIMLREPNILYLEAPVLAVGDIHGQFFDLLNLLAEGGPPGQEQYLFLGDYVDRGSFSCEVMFYLLSLKVSYPDKIWLLRGNHECATGHYYIYHTLTQNIFLLL